MTAMRSLLTPAGPAPSLPLRGAKLPFSREIFPRGVVTLVPRGGRGRGAVARSSFKRQGRPVPSPGQQRASVENRGSHRAVFL